MDKRWIGSHDWNSKAYKDGVEAFLKFAYRTKNADTVHIYCPCSRCVNRVYHNRQTVEVHIEMYGFERSYMDWIYHGELLGGLGNNTDNIGDDMSVDESDAGLNECANMTTMVREGMGFSCMIENMGCEEEPMAEENLRSDECMPKYFKLLNEAESDLYESCPKGVTELSFVVQLLHLKQLNGWTNRSFTMLLVFLKKVFPCAKIPKSYYQASKLTTDLGFTYKTWDACPNSCMLFRNETENLDKCEICGASRYKVDHANEGNLPPVDQGTKVSQKKVRYFPLIPRLQRLFWSSHTASLMKWHAEKRVEDGVMRHPADSRAWKAFDDNNPSFARDSRNVRLGLITDGFNPFGNMSVAHSTWPVVVVPYNLPPWLCMKQPNLILSILIDGPKGPGDKIDVYLQPLVEELKELWEVGVSTYDASTKQLFQLNVALLWTISDFPAYAMLSGWSTKGEFACPCCNRDHQATRLTNGGKYCYWGHRRFLPGRHKFRRERVTFNGKLEMRPPPLTLSGTEVLKQLNDLNVLTEYKKEDLFTKRKREEEEKERAKTHSLPKTRLGWKKKSIFFELQYWEHNLIRHNLDVMHIEKNVCDNVIFTLLGIKGKTKDNMKARKDLRDMKIRSELHPQPRGRTLEYLPPAEFTMSNKEKDIFLKVLRDVKVPDGYSSNISRCVHTEERSMWGLKSHDNHILMQQLLPIAIRRVLPKHVVKSLIELSNCFVVLCSSVNSITDLKNFQDRMALTLCSLEKIFPPGFFDIMEHLPMHLVDELQIAGAVLYRWMYPMERYLHTLKLYVRNRAHPEASIAKSVLLEECMTFCSRYLDNSTETKMKRPRRNDDGGKKSGRVVGKAVHFRLDPIMQIQAHRYVLANTEAVAPFIEKHLAELGSKYPQASQRHLISRLHNEHFVTWFKEHVKGLPDVQISEEIRSLASGPLKDALKFNSYIVNGFRFRTKKIDLRRKTQNSGVLLKAEQMSYSSRKDRNPLTGDVIFYGQLIDIIEIKYLNGMKYVLFKCNWVNPRVGQKVDEFNFTLVNFNHLLYKENRVIDEPYILASQAEQVWYVQDPLESDWHVVVQMSPRDTFDKYSTIVEDLEANRVEPYSMQHLDEAHNGSWVRQGVEGLVVDTNICDGDDDHDDSGHE